MMMGGSFSSQQRKLQPAATTTDCASRGNSQVHSSKLACPKHHSWHDGVKEETPRGDNNNYIDNRGGGADWVANRPQNHLRITHEGYCGSSAKRNNSIQGRTRKLNRPQTLERVGHFDCKQAHAGAKDVRALQPDVPHVMNTCLPTMAAKS